MPRYVTLDWHEYESLIHKAETQQAVRAERDWIVKRYEQFNPLSPDDALIVSGLTKEQADAVVKYLLTIHKDGVYASCRGFSM